MNDMSGFYDIYTGKSKEWVTKLDFLIDEIDDILESKFSGMDKLTQTGLFLDKEEDKIKSYVDNLLKHYIYKRIFNKARKYFNENRKLYFENDIDFKENFQVYIFKTFNLDGYENVKDFSNNLLDAILSNENEIGDEVNGRPSTKENLAMRKYANKQNRKDCYLCGTTTELKKEKDKISMKVWESTKESEFPSDYRNKVSEILEIHNSKVVKHSGYNSDYSKMTKATIDILFENTILNQFNKEFKHAYSFFNNNVMKVEHKVAVDWGGGKSEKNLLISCHKCNQDKSNISFYTEYSINKFFINEYDPEKVRLSFYGTLGHEALISLKIEQNFSCASSDCDNKLSDNIDFYLSRIDEEDGYHYLNTQIVCQHCLELINRHRILDRKDFFKEYIKL